MPSTCPTCNSPDRPAKVLAVSIFPTGVLDGPRSFTGKVVMRTIPNGGVKTFRGPTATHVLQQIADYLFED